MSIKSERLVALIAMTSSLLTLFQINGCRKEKDIRRIVVENACRDILKYPLASEETKMLAKRVLESWNNKLLDPEPVLIHAGYLQDPNKDFSLLVLHMSDEEFDIKGFGVRESHNEADQNIIVLEEEYPIFPENRIGHHQFISFQERKDTSQRKDDKAWQDYTCRGRDQLVTYRRREYPTVWLSLPDPPTVQVEIWIYDFAGRKSEAVFLEHGLPERP